MMGNVMLITATGALSAMTNAAAGASTRYLRSLRARLRPEETTIPPITVELVPLGAYDELAAVHANLGRAA